MSSYHDEKLLEHSSSIENVVQTVLDRFSSKHKTINVKIMNAYQLIVMIMEIVETITLAEGIKKKTIVINVLERIATGLDGIQNTKDDLISQNTISSIKTLLQNNLVDSLINLIAAATKGVFNINKQKKWCCF